MGWWYHIVNLEPDAKADRRKLLNQYGLYSQLSVLIPILAYQIYRLVLWLWARNQRPNAEYSAVAEPPVALRQKDSYFPGLSTRWKAAQWWLDGELTPYLGSRKRWVVGGTWSLWMLILCFSQTGHGKITWPNQDFDG